MLRLQAAGRLTFSRDEAMAALGVGAPAFHKAVERLKKQKLLLTPRRGFYVIVPSRFYSWGAPPADWYIDPLMRHEGRTYYVGLLKAAELHGAAHQAVMEFQIVTDQQLPRIRRGRSVIAFYFKRDVEGVLADVIDHKTETGSLKVSGPELTAFDLVRYANAVGGLDAIATVLSELHEKVTAEALARVARHFERTVSQRLGYLLDLLGAGEKSDALRRDVFSRSPVPWVKLEPQERKDAEPIERNERWHVYVHRKPEIDE